MKTGRNYSHQDYYIAKKLRERRLDLGFSQAKLAELLGISPQQIHKYEKEIDRVSAARLYEFAKHLSVPLKFFFQEEE